MKSLGIILIVLGALAFVYTGFTYTKKEKVLDIGPIEVNKEKKKTVSWPPIAGALLLVAGVALVLMDKRK